MKTSTEIINKAKERFKELEHKNFEWRSFYNGYLEATSEQLALLRVSCQREQLVCAYCGSKKKLKIETDLNSERIC